MRPWIKLVIGLTLVGAALAALLYLSRRKTTVSASGSETSPALASSMWAVSDALQQTHLNTLTAQVNDKVTRADVALMIQQALQNLPTTGSGSEPTQDVDLIARFNARYNQN